MSTDHFWLLENVALLNVVDSEPWQEKTQDFNNTVSVNNFSSLSLLTLIKRSKVVV